MQEKMNSNFQKPNGNFQNSNLKQNNLSAKEIPENYVDSAEKFMEAFDVKTISTSKIRSFLSLTSEVYNIENKRTAQTLDEKSLSKIQQIRVKMIYAAGRDKDVKNFIEKSNLINYLKNIGDDREKFIKFARYMESLVAYHRYFGGKE
jgi:CRISPR-associated protein Csm2